MQTAQAMAGGAGPLQTLACCLEKQASFAEVLASLTAGGAAALDGVWGSSRALVASVLARHAPGPLVVVCPQPQIVDDLVDDMGLFSTARVEKFPAWETTRGERVLHDEIYGERLRLLKSFAGDAVADLLVISMQSLLQSVWERDALVAATRCLEVGQRLDRQSFLAWLSERGFQHSPAVQLPGEYAVRGGIIDLFAPDWREPIRVELFDNEVESLRRFDPSTQRSLVSLSHVDFTVLNPDEPERAHLSDYFPDTSWILLVELVELWEVGKSDDGCRQGYELGHTVRRAFERLCRFPTITAESISQGSLETVCHLKIESVERFSGDIGKVQQELDAAGSGQNVYVVCETEAEAKRLKEIFSESRLAVENHLHFVLGRLSSGFRLVMDHVVLVSGAQIFCRKDLDRTRRRPLGRVIDSFLALRDGDLVVHLAHGIGQYRGLQVLTKNGHVEEHLLLEFHGGTKIFVPSSKIDLVQKYVGGKKRKTLLSRIGGKSWVRQKRDAEKAATDLAAEMIEIQALREARPGIRFSKDRSWQKELEATFPYQETTDQLSAIAAIKSDMEAPRPMDRLLCGDVGFGKTELAVRAAFKAVNAGYQVAVLVPTTILAEQHANTFRSRMSEFPINIAVLSRFCTNREKREVTEGLARGTIDIVVGTHRLVQSDVRFQNLGLVIIDEEQRFGVEIKERLKSLHETVDVLTMTATPIPRTLHMALLGVRNISNLATPPEERLAVETRVTRWGEEVVRHAVMRELNRSGQVYFVHNRITDIGQVAGKLQRIIPDAQLEIAHGQMAESSLEKIMGRFVDGQFDILLTTTIVENGLDIPNVNTIFVDEADRYGLADLHQLRGRVGRYKHRAYCYLLIDGTRQLSPESARRLRAIEEFSEMGAGFALAMRDLELRGAGNILGSQQSGHIATVGYELYCALMEKAIRGLKRLPHQETIQVDIDLPGEAYLPDDYVPEVRMKIDLYRRLARLKTITELAEFSAELVDRCGPRPSIVDHLLELGRLRIWAHQWCIGKIHKEDDFVVFGYTNRRLIDRLAERLAGRLRVVDRQSAYLVMEEDVMTSEKLLEVLGSVLRTN